VERNKNSARRGRSWRLGVLVVALLLSTAGHHNFRAWQKAQNNSAAPPVEAKGPIITMVMASSIDSKGQIINPTFTFPPNEPQITAIIYVGRTDGTQLKITWYKTSEKGDEKLFEHQIQVKSNERAFSVARNGSGTFELGAYKVVATLERQTDETEFDISAPKPSNKTATTYERFAGLQTQMQQISWNASSRSAPAITTAQTTSQSKRPVAGTSGTVPQPTDAPPVTTNGCNLKVSGGEIIGPRDLIADIVQIRSEGACQSTTVISVQATVRGLMQDVGSYNVSASQNASANFNVDPCTLSGGSDLPGTEVSVQAVGQENQSGVHFVAKGVITLNHDLLAPRLIVVPTPGFGSTVKAGDKISFEVTAQERRRHGPWQTGVQMIQITAKPGGSVGPGWVNNSKLPKPCNEKTWEHKYQATYTVPSNPNPTITICAIADDYVPNEETQCGEFYTIPQGQNNVVPPGCKRKGVARLGFIDGAPVLGSFDPASPDYNKISCNFRWTICGKEYIKSQVVENRANACSSFFSSAEASLPKEEYCCDCYPNCAAQRKPR
jgi:hypothetical protein